MKKLVLTLTAAQFARFELLAKLLQATPEHVALSVALSNIDSFEMGGWREWENALHADIEFYCEQRKASDKPRGSRFEDGAPNRLLTLAVRGKKGVRS